MSLRKLFIILFAPFLLNRIYCQEQCEPTNCIISEWNMWSECTETCGENGISVRLKTVLRAASCGGTCPQNLKEIEACNRRCCPKDCVYSEWTKWGLCFCDAVGCEGGVERYNCSRTRAKLQDEECGGYCDDVTMQQQCGNLCCYQNCAVSAWSFWGMCEAQCEQIGTKRRIRKVVQEPRCQGKQCDALEEVTQCTGSCCPVNCILGEWSEWSSCNVTCGESVETRVRFVQLPACDGKACSEDPVEQETRPCSRYINVDCMVSPWTVWSDCILDNGFCGKGIKTRSRTVERQPECQGHPCMNLTETGICYGQCCLQDCVVSDWSEWSHCSTSCGQGIRNRTRAILQSPSCGGSPCTDKLLDNKDCVVRDRLDCEFTDWSQWTACSTDCGVGVQSRTRTLTTPAYCGGQCENEAVEEEKDCESYEAKQNCEVSEWSSWGGCVRNCARGDQTRSRSIIVNVVCNGTLCPTDLVERRDCHLQCEQLCNVGVCSCNLGYRLSSDNVTCTEVMCPIPKVSYCPPTHREITDCREPYFTCDDGYKFNKTCTPYCSPSNWTVKGTPLLVTCQEDGNWTQPDIYCSRPNKPPIGIEVDTTVIEENKPIDFCFAYLSTITDGEEFEVHTYMIMEDITNRFYINNNRLCLARKTDYEEEPSEWEVTFRSTDIDGEYVEQAVMFEITNANDPPTSVKIEPDSVPENSAPDTTVGCLSASDDDPNQNVTLRVVDSDQETFATFEWSSKLCIKVIADFDVRCEVDGGTYCTLNKEVKDTYYITILAMDDGIPPMSAYYDVPIKLTNVNDKQTSIDIDPKQIPEELEAGSPLITFLTIDEDSDQQYTYTLLDDSNGLFKINGDKLTATRVFDFEKEAGEVFEVTVESTDDDSENPLKLSRRFLMQVADVNERPYDLQLSSINGIYQFSVNKPQIMENVPDGVIGTVSVKDDDAFDDVDLHIVAGMDANGRLSLTNRKCSSLSTVNVYCLATLVLTGSLNYEVEDHVDFSIEATDKMNATVSLDLSIEVLDTNDLPTKLLFDGKEEESVTVQEFQQHTQICNLSAVDEDVDASHTFELVDSSGGLFVIENAELWTSKDSIIDYEIEANHTIAVKCLDNGNPPLSAMFDVQITVIDVNEEPTITMLSNNKVAENSPDDTIVGELTTIDPDNEVEERQSFRYSLPEDSKGRFKLDGNRILVKSSTRICGNKPCSLDYENEPKLYVTVLTMDDGFPRLQRLDTFIIEIENANDPPTNVRLTNSFIQENQPPGTVIGLLIAEDQDGEQTFGFSLNDHQDLFGIEDGNKMVTKKSLDYEYLRSYRVTVSATDSGTPPAETEEMLVIKVLNVNEAPHTVNFSGSVDVREDVDVNSLAATLFISDPDTDETLTVSLEDLSESFRLEEPICNTILRTGATDCSVNLITKKVLNASKRSIHTVTLIIQDQRGLQSSYSVKITVIDVNNAPTNILINNLDTTKLHVPEDVDSAKIAELQTVDVDIGQTFEYNITFDSSGLFQVFNNIIKSTEPLDFESQYKNITIVIAVTDSGSPSLSIERTFTLLVDDVNEPPTSLKLLPSEVKENSLVGTTVGTFEIEDPDEHGRYDIFLIDSLNGLFVVENMSLLVGPGACVENRDVHCQIDFEKQQNFTLTALVKDDGTPPTSAQFEFMVAVLDVNEPPRNIHLHGNKVEASAETGTIVGNVTATEEDADQTYTFELLNATDIFSINLDHQLIVKNSSLLDNGEVLSVKVQVTDNGDLPASSEAILTVIVIEDLNLTISLSSEGTSQTFPLNNVTLRENISIGEKVGTIITNIPEHNRTFDISITKGGELFDITETVCTSDKVDSECRADLLVKSQIDFEKEQSVELIVEVNGDDGKKAFEHYWVTISDVNENPIGIEYSETTINVLENTVDQFLGQFYGKDPDLGDLHSFQIFGSDAFVLFENGTLFSATNATIDFETAEQIDVVVTVTDRGGLSFNKSFTIHVIDVNEKPLGLSISNNKISEMAKTGTPVGTLQVNDPDVNQLFTFAILLGSDVIFDIDGNVLKVVKEGEFCSTYGDDYCLLDYETRSTYTLQIKVTDNGNPVESELFDLKIIVEDVNEKPGTIQISSTKVDENTPINNVVAELTATERDENQTITFAVQPSDMFYIINSSLVLNTSLDFESRSTYAIQVEAQDDGLPSLSVNSIFILDVIDLNEPPVQLLFVSTVYSSTPFPKNHPQIEENLPSSTYIGQIIVNDPDNGEDISLQILPTNLMFKKKGCIPLTKGTRCTWDVSSVIPFDFEKESNLTFTVVATDGNGLQMQRDYLLKILDTNDAPTDIILTIDNATINEISVRENSLGTLLAELSVEDKETDQSYIYDITDSTKSLFVSGNELRVTSAARLDYERLPQFSVSIKVTDSGLPTLSYVKQFSVLVQDVNEAPTLAYLSSSEIAENATVGEEVGKIIVQDPDNIKQDVQTFTIAVTDENVPFQVEGNRLVVTKSEFDMSDYTIRISVTDSGTPPLSEQFQVSVHVLELNDPPTRLDFSGRVVDENAAIGDVIGRLHGRDNNAGQELTYSILDSDKFALNDRNVIVNGLIDYESGQEIIFKAMVTDNGNPPLSLERSFTVEVEDVNERPRSLKIIRNDNMAIPEKTRIYESIGAVQVIDEDETEIFEGSITVGQDLFKLALFWFVCERQVMETYTAPMTVCTNDLLLAAPVDYETITEPVSVMITVRDKGGLELKQLFTFSVTNENEPPRDIVLDRELESIPENSDGIVVGELSAIDDDRSDSHSFEVVTHWETFTIIGNKLVVRTPLDYEIKDRYTVLIGTVDNGSPAMSLNKKFDLRVADVNEAPTKIRLSHDKVEAGAEAGTVVGHISSEDPDNLGNPAVKQTQECRVSPTDLFTVNLQKSLIAKISIPADMILYDYNITITCSDSGIPQMSHSQDFLIHIVEKVIPPKGIKLTDIYGGKDVNVDENVIDSLIGNLSVVNSLTGNPYAGSYTFLVENDTDVAFTTLGSALQLLSAVNYEVTPFIECKVLAYGLDSDGNQLNLERIFKIKVNDVNEPPTDIKVYGDSKIKENLPSGTKVTDLYTIDPESYQTHTYEILGVNFGFEVSSNHTELRDVFTVDGITLKVGSNAGALNFEVSDVITLLMLSTESVNIPYSVQSTISMKIVDMNDPPTNITLSTNMVAEDSLPGTVVGTLIVEDEDANQEHNCQILNIIDVPFKVDNNTKVVVDDELDYESDKSFNIKVACMDTVVPARTRLKTSKTLMINIGNVNEPPVDIYLTMTKIKEENVIGQVIGEIKVIDLDSNQTFISLVQRDNWQMFNLEVDSTLVANAVFDFETKSYYTVTVNATDDEGATFVKHLVIQVQDINESPVSIVLDQESVSESKLPEEIIGKFSTSDPDRNQRFTYRLDDETIAQGIFVVKDNALRVGPMGLDFEKQDLYLISVTSTDSGEPPKSVEVNFTINIIDANEPPSDIIVSLTEAIPEDAAAHTVITAVQVDDPDSNQSHFCQLNDTSHMTLATKEGDVLELVLLQSLNFEKTPAVYLEISCTDGELEIQRAVTIAVSDVNEPPTSIKLSGSKTVLATAKPGHVIGQLTVDDEDDKQTHTFTFLGANWDLVEVNENNELVLKAAIPSTQLEQFDPSLKFTITVADNGDPVLTYTQTFNIPITTKDIITDELPTIGITNRNINENSKAGMIIGELFYINETNLENLYMSIEHNFENLFEIQNGTYLALAQDFSTTDTSSIFINIKVTDTFNKDFRLSIITLLVQRMCANNQEVCRDNEKCVVHNDTYSECTCQEDFEKSLNNICVAIDNCETGNDMVLCQNGGTCIDDVNSFVCNCPNGFGGDRCEIKRSENPCSNHHCLNDAICLPDIDTGTYTCSCKTGWEGDHCQSSVDDCLKGVCYNGGQCIDKHLTYLCTCTQQYKGLRCEYGENVCIEKHCNGTHLCVGLVLSEDTLCVSEEIYSVTLIYDKPDDVQELDVFQARLVDFIIEYGRFPTFSSSLVRKRRTTDSKKVQVYVVEAMELDSTYFKFSLVILDAEYEPFTRVEALYVLSTICTEIDLGDSEVTLFCPGIQKAARKPPPPSQASSSAGLIAGVICSLVIVACIAVVAFVVYKKKKKERAVRPESIETGMESGRSSGYSSKVCRPPCSPRIVKNRVAPDQTSEATASNVSELDA